MPEDLEGIFLLCRKKKKKHKKLVCYISSLSNFHNSSSIRAKKEEKNCCESLLELQLFAYVWTTKTNKSKTKQGIFTSQIEREFEGSFGEAESCKVTFM